MATIFTKIIEGELPGRFVWRDERAVAFLTIEPLMPGHTLIVPRQEIDHWIDLEPSLAEHLMRVAQCIGQGIMRAFRPARVSLLVAGFEVPHVHLHVSGADTMANLDFASADRNPDPADLDRAADALRAALRELGHAEATD